MAPMVAGRARRVVRRAGPPAGLRTAGVMVEIPAAALRAGEMLAAVDFVSIGTNDLAQYTFAADRQSGPLAALQRPVAAGAAAVWSRMAGAAGRAGPSRWASAARRRPTLHSRCVLVGLGATRLSMSAPSLSDVGAVLKSVTMQQCRDLAALAVDAEDAASGRAAVRASLPALDELGL